MKRITLLLIVLAAFGSANMVFGQFSFGVSPGLNLNSVYFGYKVGIAVPNIGFQYMHIGLKFDDSGYPDGNFEAKGNLFIPQIGCKVFVAQKNKVKAYAAFNIAKPILTGKITVDGEEDDEVKESLDNLSLLGMQFGVGAEYFFDDNFSVGGEFGLRMFHGKLKQSYTEEHWEYDPETMETTYYETQETIDVKANLNPTYSRISLNFYF